MKLSWPVARYMHKGFRMLFILYVSSLVGLFVLSSIWLYSRRKELLDASENRLFTRLTTLVAVFFLLLFFITRHEVWRLTGYGWSGLPGVVVLSFAVSRLVERKAILLAILTATGLSLILGAAVWKWDEGLGAFLNPAHDGGWEILVELEAGEQPEALWWSAHRYGLLIEPAFDLPGNRAGALGRYYAVEVPEHWEHRTSAILRILQGHRAVAYSELNEILQIQPIEASAREIPDTLYGLNDPDIGRQWGFETMDLRVLFEVLSGEISEPRKQSLLVILDTGIDGGHEDLSAQYRSIRKTYDRDKQGHGTHCAGIAAAVSNNGTGIASMFPRTGLVEIASIRVLNDFGIGTQRQIIQGMIEAANAGADVISMSLGGRSSDPQQRAYQEAVQYCNDAGAIVVVAAGNDGAYARDITPANVPGVITVSAIDTLMNRASFSNRVASIGMALSAPGVSIYSTLPDNRYAAQSGTSMAAPQVAAAVALLRAFEPEIKTENAYELLRASGRPSNQPEETGAVIRPGYALMELLVEMSNTKQGSILLSN